MRTVTITILLLTCQIGFTQNADSLNVAPNPFNTSTYIYYGLATNDTVSIYMYNMLGQTVKTFIHDSLLNSGYYSIYFPSDSLTNGIYFVSLNLGIHKTITKKVIKNSVSSIGENLALNELVIYPNPTNNLLTISLGGVKNVVITDMLGKPCKTIRTRENSISLADLKPGSYIIKVFSTDNTLLLTEKVVKL